MSAPKEPPAASVAPPPPEIDVAALPEQQLRLYRETFSKFDAANEGFINRQGG
jgi:hypothetical protein